MANNAAFHEVDHIFGNVYRMVGDPFESFGNVQQVDHLPSPRGIGANGPLNTLINFTMQPVDGIVVTEHGACEFQIARDQGVKAVG